MEITSRRRRVISTALALVLALESVTVVAVAARTTVSQREAHRVAASSPAGIVPPGALAPDAAPVKPPADPPADPSASGQSAPAANVATTVPAVPSIIPPDLATVEPAATPPARASLPARAPKPTTSSHPKAKASPAKSGAGRAPAAPVSHSGRNHVWIPALGISRSVSPFPCDRSRPPDNFVYRWGCAGANNVYLMGHAYSVFKSLHDAYVAGRLRVGMKAWYADSAGRVHLYTVRWWKTTRPTPSASWAWAGQSTPSMTLQTCIGANSEYRLVVRLVEVGG